MREDDDVYPNGEHFSQEMEMSIVKKNSLPFKYILKISFFKRFFMCTFH